jgi:hypothetical protein
MATPGRFVQIRWTPPTVGLFLSTLVLEHGIATIAPRLPGAIAQIEA